MPTLTPISITYDMAYHHLCGFDAPIQAFNPELLIGIARSGIVPTTMLAQRLGYEASFIRKNRNSSEVRWLYGIKPMNQRLLLIDDLSYSGGTLAVVKQYLEASGNQVRTLALFHDVRDSHLLTPDISTPIDRWVKFPWDARENTSISLEKRTQRGGHLLPSQEAPCYLMCLDNHWQLLGENHFNHIPPEQVCFYTALPKTQAVSLQQHIRSSIFSNTMLYCLGSDESNILQEKLHLITTLGISHYLDSNHQHALHLAQQCVAIDVIWVTENQSYRLGGITHWTN